MCLINFFSCNFTPLLGDYYTTKKRITKKNFKKFCKKNVLLEYKEKFSENNNQLSDKNAKVI